MSYCFTLHLLNSQYHLAAPLIGLIIYRNRVVKESEQTFNNICFTQLFLFTVTQLSDNFFFGHKDDCNPLSQLIVYN